MTTRVPETETSDELVLEPPTPASSSGQEQTDTLRVDEATAARIASAVSAYIDSLSDL